MKSAQSLIIILLLFSTVFLFYKQDKIKQELNETRSTLPLKSANSTIEESTETHVGVYMQQFQYYVTKLYFAGINKNTELQEFYIEELEEYMEELAEKNVFDDGINISQNIELYGLKSLSTFEKQLEMGIDFNESYSNLLNGCNSCHKVSKHSFIHITIPKNNGFNQQF